MSAYLPGRSTNILPYNSEAVYDRIILPNHGWGSCWRFAVRSEYQNDSDLGLESYRGSITSVTFSDEPWEDACSKKVLSDKEKAACGIATKSAR